MKNARHIVLAAAVGTLAATHASAQCSPDQMQLLALDHIGSALTDAASGGEFGIAQTFTPTVTGVICDITVWLNDNNMIGNVNPRIHFFGVDAFGAPDASNYLGGNLVGAASPLSPSAYTFNVSGLAINAVAGQKMAFHIQTSGTNAASGFLDFYGTLFNSYAGGEMFRTFNPFGPGVNPSAEQFFGNAGQLPPDLYFIETVLPVPAPGAVALMSLGGVMTLRRRR